MTRLFKGCVLPHFVSLTADKVLFRHQISHRFIMGMKSVKLIRMSQAIPCASWQFCCNCTFNNVLPLAPALALAACCCCYKGGITPRGQAQSLHSSNAWVHLRGKKKKSWKHLWSEAVCSYGQSNKINGKKNDCSKHRALTVALPLDEEGKTGCKK